MSWKPTNQPVRYDEARVAQLKPIQAEIEKLDLPLIRLRKLKGLCNALELQIEDGGDSPEVNRLLLDALRAAAQVKYILPPPQWLKFNLEFCSAC